MFRNTRSTSVLTATLTYMAIRKLYSYQNAYIVLVMMMKTTVMMIMMNGQRRFPMLWPFFPYHNFGVDDFYALRFPTITTFLFFLINDSYEILIFRTVFLQNSNA